MLRTLSLVIFTLVAFAANSLFCRLALLNNSIDPISFTTIRLISGAITLLAILLFFAKERLQLSTKRNGWGAVTLLIYAITFSLAYIQLDTATGALILFGTVQFTMIVVTQLKGQQLNYLEWAGFIIALSGFLYLTLPQFVTPSWSSLVLMMLSGTAWGLYTLNGKGSEKPLVDTAMNFLIASPLILISLGFSVVLLNQSILLSAEGIILAIASGSLASGVGYSLWYSLLPTISTSQAATGQLMVPILAGVGGIVFVGESLTLTLLIAGAVILFGIYLTILAKRSKK